MCMTEPALPVPDLGAIIRTKGRPQADGSLRCDRYQDLYYGGEH